MTKRFIASCLILLAALLGTVTPGTAAQHDDIMPTEIPWEPDARKHEQARLMAIPASQRSLVETRQLILLAISAAGEASERSALISDARRLLRHAQEKFPDDAELQAFDGTLTSMEAGAPGLDSMTAMTYARQGFRKLDATVAKSPLVLGARLQRALTFMRSPRFLGKGPTAQADFEYLLNKVPKDTAYNGLRAMLLFHLGETQTDNGAPADAKESWRRSAGLSAPGWSARAAARLKEDEQ